MASNHIASKLCSREHIGCQQSYLDWFLKVINRLLSKDCLKLVKVHAATIFYWEILCDSDTSVCILYCKCPLFLIYIFGLLRGTYGVKSVVLKSLTSLFASISLERSIASHHKQPCYSYKIDQTWVLGTYLCRAGQDKCFFALFSLKNQSPPTKTALQQLH